MSEMCVLMVMFTSRSFYHCTISCVCSNWSRIKFFSNNNSITLVQMWPPSWSCSKAVYKPVWLIPLLSVQWIDSWWWTEEPSETCRVSWQNKFVKLVHLVGFIIKNGKCHMGKYPSGVVGTEFTRGGSKCEGGSQELILPSIVQYTETLTCASQHDS
jgi:hypothetical protein